MEDKCQVCGQHIFTCIHRRLSSDVWKQKYDGLEKHCEQIKKEWRDMEKERNTLKSEHETFKERLRSYAVNGSNTVLGGQAAAVYNGIKKMFPEIFAPEAPETFIRLGDMKYTVTDGSGKPCGKIQIKDGKLIVEEQ